MTPQPREDFHKHFRACGSISRPGIREREFWARSERARFCLWKSFRWGVVGEGVADAPEGGPDRVGAGGVGARAGRGGAVGPLDYVTVDVPDLPGPGGTGSAPGWRGSAAPTCR